MVEVPKGRTMHRRPVLLQLGLAIIFSSCVASAERFPPHAFEVATPNHVFLMGHSPKSIAAFGFAPRLSSIPPESFGTSLVICDATPLCARGAVRHSHVGSLKAQLPNPFQGLFGSDASTQDRQFHQNRQDHVELKCGGICGECALLADCDITRSG